MTLEFANDRDTGNMANGEHLTSAIDFYTLTTTVPLSIADFETGVAAQNLIRIGEIIGMQAQPVVAGLHAVADVSAVSALPAGAGYQFKFMIEHTGAWAAGVLAATLASETAACALPSGDALVLGVNAQLDFSPIL
jgi:hypothetical protein